MKSPFPGMDPYLEAHWPDVHTKLVTYAADALNERLPGELVASTEERVAVESDIGITHEFSPDVSVLEPANGTMIAADAEAAPGVATAYRLVAQVEPITERFIKIVEPQTQRLVTVIEFISPTNKRTPGIEGFRGKRAELLAAGVNFVEVDLVRAGNWQRLLLPQSCPPKLLSPYRVTFRLPSDPPAVYLIPIRLNQTLPSIGIPLRSKDPRVELELQPLIDRTYSNGRYDRRLDYRQELELPLEGDDAAWVEELLKSAGKR